jgi:hypothetical protein
VYPSVVDRTLEFPWKTDLLASAPTSVGITFMIPRDQLTDVVTLGNGNVITIEDGFTSLTRVQVKG